MEQSMVYERVSEIGVRKRKSVAGTVIRGPLCCGKFFGMGEGGRCCHKKRQFTTLCEKGGWW